jgi:rSAM/selenodomain-associated transferase 2
MMIRQPGLSVIIPTLNEAVPLRGLLNKLLEYSEVEIIVSDGGSGDETVNLARMMGATATIGAANRGAQLNRGAALAAAPLLLFLHADSKPGPGLIEELLQIDPYKPGWGCAIIAFTHPGHFYTMLGKCSNLRARLLHSCYGDQAIYCSQALFQQIGGFPEWPLFEDAGFSRRARKLIRPAILSAKVEASSRRYEQNGPWKTVFLVQLLKLLFCLGVSPHTLSRLYRSKKSGRTAGRGNHDGQNPADGI